MATDQERLMSTLKALGVKYAERHVEPPVRIDKEAHAKFSRRQWEGRRPEELPTIANEVILDEGVGYFGFFACFYFDADGNFLDHGVWE